MAGGLALLLGMALAADGVVGEIGMSAEARSRSLRSGGSPWHHALELALAPAAALQAERGEAGATARYAPRLVAPDLRTGATPVAVHDLRLEGRLVVEPRLRLAVRAGGFAGTTSLLDEAWRSGLRGAVPTAERLGCFEVRLGAAAAATLDPTTSLGATVEWTRGGGLARADRRLLPRQEALQVDATLRWRASPLDRLDVSLSAGQTRLEAAGRATLATLSAAWRRRLLPGLEAWAGAGATLVVADELHRPAETRAAPVGELGLEHAAAGLAFSQRLLLRAAPAVDRLQGTVDPRQALEYGAALGALPGWRLSARASAAVTTTDLGAEPVALGELRLERRLAGELLAWVAILGARQRVADPARPSFTELGALAGVEWRPCGALPPAATRLAP
jgi:hypothetical protein